MGAKAPTFCQDGALDFFEIDENISGWGTIKFSEE